MQNTFRHAGYEDAILNSGDDFEPYGFVSPRLQPVNGTSHEFDPARREIEAAVLRVLHD